MRFAPKACAPCWAFGRPGPHSRPVRKDDGGERSPTALADLGDIYAGGADPLVVLQDLLEITQLSDPVESRARRRGFFDGGSGEARRARRMAARLPLRRWRARGNAAQGPHRRRMRYGLSRPPRWHSCPAGLCDRSSAYRQNWVARTAMERAESTPTPSSRRARPAPAPNATTSPWWRRRVVNRPAPWRRLRPAPPGCRRSPWRCIHWPKSPGFAGLKGAAVLRCRSSLKSHASRAPGGGANWSSVHALARHGTLAVRSLRRLKDGPDIPLVVTLAREGGEPTLAEQKKAARPRSSRCGAGASGACGARPLSRAEIVAVRERADRDRSLRSDGRIVMAYSWPHFPPVPRSKSWCSSLAKLPGLAAFRAPGRRSVLLKKREALARAPRPGDARSGGLRSASRRLRQSRHDESMCGVP